MVIGGDDNQEVSYLDGQEETMALDDWVNNVLRRRNKLWVFGVKMYYGENCTWFVKTFRYDICFE